MYDHQLEMICVRSILVALTLLFCSIWRAEVDSAPSNKVYDCSTIDVRNLTDKKVESGQYRAVDTEANESANGYFYCVFNTFRQMLDMLIWALVVNLKKQ